MIRRQNYDIHTTCSACGEPDGVYAESLDDVRAGRGLCQACAAQMEAKATAQTETATETETTIEANPETAGTAEPTEEPVSKPARKPARRGRKPK